MLYRPDRDGWMFTDIPIRRMSPMAAYFAGERGGENNTGEPYIYIVCPWCSERFAASDVRHRVESE